MRKIILAFVVLIAGPGLAQAQDQGLFGKSKDVERAGFIITFNGGVDWPGGDMAQRFGTSFRVGPGLLYKTRNNWLFGAKADFIFGNTIREDSLMWNLKESSGRFYNYAGERVNIGIGERGYDVGLQAGKIFPFTKGVVEQGVILLTGVGFVQHKIGIVNKNAEVPQLSKGYQKGYDRLTNGIYVEQFAGYNYFGKGGMLNFNIGLNIMAGFTQGRRDWQYDLMRPGDEKRLDLLFGIRGSFYIPLFKKKADEIYFE